MHHSPDPRESHELADRIRRLAEQQGLGATGAFPAGKFSEDDEGEIRLAVGHEAGKVIVSFGTPVAWFAMEPRQARQMAESLRQHSHTAEGK
jgi:hypothetical protein